MAFLGRISLSSSLNIWRNRMFADALVLGIWRDWSNHFCHSVKLCHAASWADTLSFAGQDCQTESCSIQSDANFECALNRLSFWAHSASAIFSLVCNYGDCCVCQRTSTAFLYLQLDSAGLRTFASTATHNPCFSVLILN